MAMDEDLFLPAVKAQAPQTMVICVLNVLAYGVRSPAWKQFLNYPFTGGSQCSTLDMFWFLLSSLRSMTVFDLCQNTRVSRDLFRLL